MSKIKKCFIIAFFVFALFVLNQIDVNAAENLPAFSTLDKSALSTTFKDSSKYLICKNSGGWVICLFPDNLKIYYSNSYIYAMDDSKQACNYYVFWISSDGKYWDCNHNVLGNNFKYFSDFQTSSVDILNYSDDSVFFWQTPATLEEVVEVEARKQTIMKEIAGCLKFLIPFLIFLLGFWKALRFVLRLLRQS